MSGDCCVTIRLMNTLTAWNKSSSLTYPISRMHVQAILSKSSFDLVVISPPITTRFDFTKVSQATRLNLSPERHASRTASEIVSATLSGCPSPTDSEEKMYLLAISHNTPHKNPRGRGSYATSTEQHAAR